MDPYGFTLYMYNLALIPVIFFSLLFVILTFINIFLKNEDETKKYNMPDPLPFVSVQVPTFNDPIAVRCVEKCMEFDYPRDRYEIVIVDDSTNPDTQVLLSKFALDNPGFIKFIHRTNREGFKPGALRNAMKITKGEIITIFDSDWVPKKDFLKKIVRPFSDPKVAIVQTRQGFYNHKTNIITRFAAYTLMMYHTIVMPINNKVNCVFFCGTAGALRRKYVDEVGGWNQDSVTEDSELSVKLLMKGYRTVYLDYETPSEVPDTFEAFLKQQTRWCYGNARVFFDNISNILFKRGLTIWQRLMISFITLTNSSTVVVIIMS
jgi:cellulose synthase/poly-beta-1,6-N-acetylglucosamine synthase-like glycosyltransferase